MKVGSDLQEKWLCSRYAACMALNAANFRSASATLPYMPLLPAWQPALLPLTPPSRLPCMHCTSSQPRFRGESIHQLNYDLTRNLRRTQLALPHHINVAMHGHAPPMNLRLAAALPPQLQPRLPPHSTANQLPYPARTFVRSHSHQSVRKHCFVCLLSSCYRIVGCVRLNNATCISRISAAFSSARAAPQTRIDTPTFL